MDDYRDVERAYRRACEQVILEAGLRLPSVYGAMPAQHLRERTRRLARIGGSDVSQEERERSVSWRTFQAHDGQTLKGRDRCHCGAMTGKLYRGRWWCQRCGRAKKGPKKGPNLNK